MQTSTNKLGLILTVGFSTDNLIYTIKQKDVSHVVFIGTEKSIEESMPKVVEATSLKPGRYKFFEITDTPEQIGKLCESCNEAFQWLLNKGISTENIIADPSGAKKWMSAGVTMVASFLGIKMLYVDVNYENGKVVESSMKLIELGNAYDQTGFITAEQGRIAFNKYDYEGAAFFFSKITPSLSHKADLFQGISETSKVLGRWDRFEHYSNKISIEMSAAISKFERSLITGGGHPKLFEFIEKLKKFHRKLVLLEGQEQLNQEFIIDILLNSKRCIERERYDDGVARLYRTLEAIAQYLLLSKYDISSDKPDFKQMLNKGIITQERLDDFKKQCRDGILPEKLDLLLSMRLLDFLGFEHADLFFSPKKDFKLLGLLNIRNSSLLAHGFKPIEKVKANEFYEKIYALLEKMWGETLQEIVEKLEVPSLPSLGL
jgi:CRISPR-associated protein (TIGR02710 family)